MNRKEGSLGKLLHQLQFNGKIDKVIETAFVHMLEALIALAANDPPIVYRDVKPANNSYTTNSDGYHFQLGDFGLTNEIRRRECQS